MLWRDGAHGEELLGELADLVANDQLAGSAPRYMAKVDAMVERFLGTGVVATPPDPFRGRDPQAADDPNHFAVMFWRMFDKTPAAMIQDFAIPVRRILARKVFEHLGEDVTIHHNVLFNRGGNISVGDGALLNRDVMLDDRAEITIGPYVMVAAGVTIETHTHPFDDFSRPIATSGRAALPVSIDENTVLGYNTVVMAGVRIGRRCVVGANSVVTKDVADYHVVGGVPAKTIRELRPPPGVAEWRHGGAVD
jgi:acetyltransferase-like isoleucine patch superfamily enzyme